MEAQTVASEVGLAIDQVYAAKLRVLKQLRAELLMLAEDLPLFVPLDERVRCAVGAVRDP